MIERTVVQPRATAPTAHCVPRAQQPQPHVRYVLAHHLTWGSFNSYRRIRQGIRIIPADQSFCRWGQGSAARRRWCGLPRRAPTGAQPAGVQPNKDVGAQARPPRCYRGTGPPAVGKIGFRRKKKTSGGAEQHELAHRRALIWRVFG